MLPKRERYIAFARGTFAAAVALFWARIISLLYSGERPFQALGTAPKAAYLQNAGFPSDHALLVFMVVLVVWAATKNKLLTLVLLIMALLVGVGRVIALVHTPADIAGGALCALVAAICVYGRQLVKLQK
jgi:undecaprenyl-diphosphatase